MLALRFRRIKVLFSNDAKRGQSLLIPYGSVRIILNAWRSRDDVLRFVRFCIRDSLKPVKSRSSGRLLKRLPEVFLSFRGMRMILLKRFL